MQETSPLPLSTDSIYDLMDNPNRAPAEGPSLGADDPSIIVWIEIDTYLAVTRYASNLLKRL